MLPSLLSAEGSGQEEAATHSAASVVRPFAGTAASCVCCLEPANSSAASPCQFLHMGVR